jgi:hypothetical protein
MKACQGVAFLFELGTGTLFKVFKLPSPYFLIGIVNFPNGNFDNFDLRPPPVPSGIGEPVDFIIA